MTIKINKGLAVLGVRGGLGQHTRRVAGQQPRGVHACRSMLSKPTA